MRSVPVLFDIHLGSLESTVESPFLKKLSFHQKMELTVESPVLSSATILESGVEFYRAGTNQY